MGHALQDLGIDRLPVDQKVKLVQEIWDSITQEVGALPPSPEEKVELERRLAEDQATPGDVLTWEEIKADAAKRWCP